MVFAIKQTTYNPQKTKGKPYTCTRASGGGYLGDINSKKVAGWVTQNNGDRFPITVINMANETGFHPTQKPVALFEYLIKTYTNEGDLVLDNCSGSGTTAIASLNTKRNFICIEKDKEYFEKSCERLENYKKQLTLF